VLSGWWAKKLPLKARFNFDILDEV